MHVYLDSAQFAWLERASASERDEFRTVCLSATAEIVVSLEHLIEIGQLQTSVNAVSRARSLGVLPRLRSAGRSSVEVVLWEIRRQLAVSLGHAVPDEGTLRKTLFPVCTARDLEQSVAAMFPVFQAMKSAFAMGAEAEAMSKSARVTPPAAFHAPVVPTAEQVAEARSVFLSQTDNPRIRAQWDALFERVLPHVSGRTQREALLSMFGLNELPSARRAPESDLTSIAALFDTAETIAAELLGIEASKAAQRELALQFDPYKCRGIRLRLAANRARRPHPATPKASDQLDEGHVIFAPYVDLMFVDKRTRAFLEQEVRKDSALCLHDDLENVVVPRSLQQVMRIVEARATSR